MKYEKFLNIVEERKEDFYSVSDYIWDNPETSFVEYKSAKYIMDYLRNNGFEVTSGLSGIPTAFKATFGKGEPRMGILAEFDALEGMSQEGNCAEKKSVPGSDMGHGCGHNLFAGGSVAAAMAVKAYIEKTGKGSITLFGCPGEEGGGGKVYMARDGIFNDIDSVVSWHPECMNMVRTRPALATLKIDYTFEGTASHAGAAPDKGRSALDAVELMNIGANFMREHMPLTARIHYAILDAGGTAPNMVQSHAVVQYMIRSVDMDSVRELCDRVERIAKGAALMTDTEVSSQVVSSYANLITIPALQSVANEAMHDIPLPQPDEEELEYGRKIQATLKLTDMQRNMPTFATEVLEPAPPVAHGGSTDTADVSWNCPTVQMHIANWAVGTPAHSWQAVSQCRGTYAKKTMLYAGKAVAATIMRLLDNPSLIEKAKEEHKQKIGAGYVCGTPDSVKPQIQPNPEKQK